MNPKLVLNYNILIDGKKHDHSNSPSVRGKLHLRKKIANTYMNVEFQKPFT